MEYSSRKWAGIISTFASLLYFVIIFAQVPLFRFPCRVGICTTPIEVTACQLISSETLPEVFTKALIYPGAVTRSLISFSSVPSHDKLLESYKANMVIKPHAFTDLKHLEVIAGSYFCVGGALLGATKRGGRTSLYALMLVVLGVLKERYSRIGVSQEAYSVYPRMAIAIVIAFCCVRKDLRRLIRSLRSKNAVKKWQRIAHKPSNLRSYG